MTTLAYGNAPPSRKGKMEEKRGGRRGKGDVVGVRRRREEREKR